MAGKVFILVGLSLQLVSVAPAAYLAFRTTRDTFVGEFGTETSSITGPDKQERWWLFAGFALIALGAVLQILGVLAAR